MSIGLLSLIIFGALVLLLLLGVPIAFSLLAVSAVGIFFVWGPRGLMALYNSAYGEGTSFLLLAIPLFVLMANVLKFSGLADELYEIVHRWMGGLRGGLAMGTVVICAIFAAMAGISSVATVSMGLIALPAMLDRRYDRVMAVGCINAGGALGILIPPSIIMILYGSMAEVSIGQLFAGGILPGILMSVIFIIYIGVRCWINPALAPAIEERYTMVQKLASLKGIILPVALVVLVLGVIYTGVATPTEAAAVGAGGAEAVGQRLAKKEPLPPDQLERIRALVKHHQQRVGYSGDYQAWIAKWPGYMNAWDPSTGGNAITETMSLDDGILTLTQPNGQSTTLRRAPGLEGDGGA